jgi:hypothetical protein
MALLYHVTPTHRQSVQNAIGNEEPITGWRLVGIYAAGIIGGWSAVCAIAYGLGRLAAFLAGA